MTADDGVQRAVGLRALVPLIEAASPTEGKMIDEVTATILEMPPRENDVDSGAPLGDNKSD